MIRHYANLTNGLGWWTRMPEPRSVIRIPSTYLEQKLFDDLLRGLDAAFLLAIASGDECIVYDQGARKPTSRAIWQGLPFIVAALSWRWRRVEVPVVWRGHDASVYAHGQIRQLDPKTKSYLDYFKRYDLGGPIVVRGVCEPTDRDGDKRYYADEVSDRSGIGEEVST